MNHPYDSNVKKDLNKSFGDVNSHDTQHIESIDEHSALQNNLESTADDQSFLLHREQLEIVKEKVITGHTHIQIRTVTESCPIDVSLTQKTVHVETIPINEFVEDIPKIHKQGNVTTIPVFEEKMVMVKKIFLKEMIKITENIQQQDYQDQVELKKQESHISFENFNSKE